MLTRPNVGFMPTTPQRADGMRTEPPVSEPRAPYRRLAATAAAEPLLEPPEILERSCGLRVGPKYERSPVGP